MKYSSWNLEHRDNKLTEVAIPEAVKGNSLMTVFNPIDEMSLSCSLSDDMFVHKCSTIVST